MRRDPLPAETLDAADRAIINALQEGFPLSHHPFVEASAALGLSEEALIERIGRLRELGVITRFGPFFDAEAMGGAFCLCAMAVPRERFDEVVTLVNAHREVAHNYERSHHLNMWFVLAWQSRRSPSGAGSTDAGPRVHGPVQRVQPRDVPERPAQGVQVRPQRDRWGAGGAPEDDRRERSAAVQGDLVLPVELWAGGGRDGPGDGRPEGRDPDGDARPCGERGGSGRRVRDRARRELRPEASRGAVPPSSWSWRNRGSRPRGSGSSRGAPTLTGSATIRWCFPSGA